MPKAPRLEQLVPARSALTDDVLEYLDKVAEDAARLPGYYPKRLQTAEEGKTPFDQIRQMVQVVEDRSAFEKWAAEERERMRASGQEADERRYSPTRAYAPDRERPEDESAEQTRRERERPAPPPPVAWDEHAGRRFRRALILGDPGFGKTWLLRYEARRLATEATRQLREKTIGLDEVVLPIFTRLSNLKATKGPLDKALVKLIGSGRSRHFCEFAHSKIITDRCVILLDAWDEVQPKEALRPRIEDFSREFPQCRVLMTSRIVGYDSIQPPVVGAQELELLAFDAPETESFAQVWFGSDTDGFKKFQAMLRQNHQVRGLSRIPLMLALMCRVYDQCRETRKPFPTRRVELYDLCLRGLLRDWPSYSGRAQTRTVRGTDRLTDAHVSAVLELLCDVALSLFAEKCEQFEETVLCDKIEESQDRQRTRHSTRKLLRRDPGDLIRELKEGGIFIAANDQEHPPLLFLHRTFQEYLAAGAIAAVINDPKRGWQAAVEIAGKKPTAHLLVDKKAWDPAWEEVLILMAGQLDDPVPLLEMLANPRPTETNPHGDDIFRHRLCLAGRCLPELRLPEES